ncbi:MAG: SpoVR family protein [Candidatus Schekmanbacteria bacterium]|nr:SpoVR family protein [Candidatus Schekmanbacteria bacterium]
MRFPTELKKIKYELEKHAEKMGLDFFPVVFEVVEFDEMNAIASRGGFPTRYPHWRFGMEYERLSKSYAYGLHKIYEMVINNDPCYAYLLEGNNIVDQKIVIAHVYAHCDFFKNNFWFQKTNRKMMDEMANHASRIWKFIEKYGYEKVEKFIDICLSIENLIDVHSVHFSGRTQVSESDADARIKVDRLRSKDYMESFINPPEFIAGMRKKKEDELAKKKEMRFTPQKDILQFLIENARLQKWEQDILSVIREESYYFAPQGQTKIMNEGWASYWHSKIMTSKALNDAEIIDYADHHSGTLGVRPGSINPYKLGLELFRAIEERWNKGKFGTEYMECEDYEEKRKWDKKTGLGMEKIFEVRKTHNDITFIDDFLTPEFCLEHKLFVYSYNNEKNVYEISDREFRNIKSQLLLSLTNFGKPVILVDSSNYKNRGELLLTHNFSGAELNALYAKSTLENIYKIWQKPVNIHTRINDIKVIMTFDGEKHETSTVQ